MKNNSWKSNYLTDFQENSYHLLSSLQDPTLNISWTPLIQFTQMYAIYLKFFAILFSYPLLNLSNDILLSDFSKKCVKISPVSYASCIPATHLHLHLFPSNTLRISDEVYTIVGCR
jgi:hypothetical protein